MSELVELPESTAESVQISDVQLCALQRYYKINENKRGVSEFLEEEQAVFPLLVEAVAPLNNAFCGQVFHLRVLYSDDGRLLKVEALLPADFHDPDQALRSFDQAWWLDNCHRSGGALVFDYELQDAV